VTFFRILLENAAATGAGFFALILMLGPVSGAHFNPVVSFVDAYFGGTQWRRGAALPARPGGRVHLRGKTRQPDVLPIGGAHLHPPPSQRGALPLRGGGHRGTDPGHLLSPSHPASSGGPAAVGTYIAAAYFFTSSTSFANPAITLGRMFSDTFAGIAPSSAPSFIAAQVIGGVVAVGVIKVLYPTPEREPGHHSDPVQAI
jgi:hypothetical protein